LHDALLAKHAKDTDEVLRMHKLHVNPSMIPTANMISYENFNRLLKRNWLADSDAKIAFAR